MIIIYVLVISCGAAIRSFSVRGIRFPFLPLLYFTCTEMISYRLVDIITMNFASPKIKCRHMHNGNIILMILTAQA